MIENIIKINADFLIKNQLFLEWKEFTWAIEKQLFSPIEVINYACAKLEKFDDETTLRLAILLKNEASEVIYILQEIPNLNFEKSQTKDKWLFISLLWVYKSVNEKSAALEIVELIYSFFDYPKVIEPFVKYMPADEPALATFEQNINRLHEKWYQYLIQQNALLVPNFNRLQ